MTTYPQWLNIFDEIFLWLSSKNLRVGSSKKCMTYNSNLSQPYVYLLLILTNLYLYLSKVSNFVSNSMYALHSGLCTLIFQSLKSIQVYVSISVMYTYLFMIEYSSSANRYVLMPHPSAQTKLLLKQLECIHMLL